MVMKIMKQMMRTNSNQYKIWLHRIMQKGITANTKDNKAIKNDWKKVNRELFGLKY